MTIYYIDPQAATNGNGTSPATPMNSFVGVVWAAGNRVRIKRGSTFTGVFAPGAAGTSGNPIIIEAYYNADGSDDVVQPFPVLNVTSPLNTYGGGFKDYIEYYHLDIRANLSIANDMAVIFCGHSSVVRRCRITSNVGCIGLYSRNNVSITNNVLDGVTHGTANNNNIIIINSDTAAINNVRVSNNTVIHRGGGSSLSHCIRVEGSTYAINGLILDYNLITPPAGVQYCTNQATIAMRLTRCPSAVVRWNKSYGMLSGVFVAGGGADVTGMLIERNDFSNMYQFGVHLTKDTHNFTIQYNTCNYNGTNVVNSVLSAYGRGIEISSSGGENATGGHTIRFNTCCYNKNYGGPSDNGSEGVGIGLDDGTINNLVYGNYVAFNEGNGIQLYGGTLTETGGNKIIANYLDSNCTASYTSRRTGGTVRNNFNGHIALANNFGKQTVVANNIFMGPTLCGVTESSNCANVVKANNIFYGVRYPISFTTGYNCFNNVFHAKDVVMVKYTSGAAYDGAGNPAFTTLAYSGTGDITADPMLDRKYRPLAGSPCIGAGKHVGAFSDYTGRPFKTPTSIGPYEVY